MKLMTSQWRRSVAAQLFLAALLTTMTVGEQAQAEPKMRAVETPLEGTNIISMRVNRSGNGHIELWCHRCENNRITLKVRPDSYVTVNGNRQSVGSYYVRERDFISGFYRKEDGVLTRLKVSR